MVAKIMQAMDEGKMSFALALAKVADDAAAAAHAQAQPPNPGGPPDGGPPTGQDMAAGPTAQALTGSPIPGISQGQTDIAALMTGLRKPVRTVVPEGNLVQGGV
jgi:hypothetical protein